MQAIKLEADLLQIRRIRKCAAINPDCFGSDDSRGPLKLFLAIDENFLMRGDLRDLQREDECVLSAQLRTASIVGQR